MTRGAVGSFPGARDVRGAQCGLVLSVFPGIDLLGRAFEEEGFCVVRGPDTLWGGEIRQFHPPAGRFEGVIGGPPCQHWSRLSNLVRHVYGPEKVAPDLIPEFERVVAEAAPDWFLMEEVPEAPEPRVPGYQVHAQLLADVWVGGETSRKRRFSFGSRDGRRLQIEQLALHRPDPLHAVLASGGQWVPVALGGSGKLTAPRTSRYFAEAVLAQGLPADFDLPGMTVAAKIKAIGNAVPMAMGRAVAKAVKTATGRT